MNPAGTMISEAQMKAICDGVLEENRRRKSTGERALYVMYDQVYRMLAFDGREHLTPVGVAPEMAAYTLFTDAISKCFGATGLRVGWVAAPPFIAARIKALMTHMGAWAPRPEQIGTARFLENEAAVSGFLDSFKRGIRARHRLPVPKRLLLGKPKDYRWMSFPLRARSTSVYALTSKAPMDFQTRMRFAPIY